MAMKPILGFALRSGNSIKSSLSVFFGRMMLLLLLLSLAPLTRVGAEPDFLEGEVMATAPGDSAVP